MIEHVFQINYDFQPWTLQHTIPVLLFTLFGTWLIRSARSWTEEDKWDFPYKLSWALPASILFWMLARLIRGEFDPSEDLPFHMCNFITFFIPFIFVRKRPNQLIFGIAYFWVLSGTLQAILTPGLEQSFPHFWYIRYWLVHCGLVIAVLYAAIVLKYRPTWRDILNAFIAMNLLMIVAFAVNHLFNSNYLYVLEKPKAASLLDYFGPWPWYIIQSEIVALLFFVFYYTPFWLKKSKE